MIRTFGSVTGVTNQPQGLDIGIGATSPWLNDWSAYQTVYNWAPQSIASVPASSYATAADITGTGFLVFARGRGVTDVTSAASLRITVDGVATVFDGIANAASGQSNAIFQPIFFSKSLKIEVFNSRTSAQNIECDYTYLLKNGVPDATKQTILRASQRKSAYLQTSSTTIQDVVNVTGAGYLLEIEAYSWAANAIVTLIIDGVTKINARTLYDGSTGAFTNPILLGPIRFNTSLRLQLASSASGTLVMSKTFYTLD